MSDDNGHDPQWLEDLKLWDVGPEWIGKAYELLADPDVKGADLDELERYCKNGIKASKLKRERLSAHLDETGLDMQKIQLLLEHISQVREGG